MNNLYDTPAGTQAVIGAEPEGTPEPPAPSRKGRMLRWGAGITLAGFLAGGGIALAVSGPTGPSVSAGQSANAAVLNSALSTAGSPAASVPRNRIRWALGRLRALGGVHGEFTFYNKTGFHTVAFERGTIIQVSGSDLVVRAPDGTVWTWLIVGNTVVRESGSKTTTSVLADGETVFAAGPVLLGARDARLIVVRSGGSGSPASGSGSSNSVSGSSGTSVS